MMNIVVGYDGSKYGKWALEWAGRLPLNASPKLTVVHVVDQQSVRAPCMFQPMVGGNQRLIREEIARLEQWGDRVVTEARQSGIVEQLSGKVVKKRGSIPDVILSEVPKRQGLVVLGSRGLDALDRFMLGSTSMRAALHAPCPVLVVKHPPRNIQRILLAIDGSPSSRKGLGFVLAHFAPTHRRSQRGNRSLEMIVAHVLPKEQARLKCTVTHVQEAAEALREAGFVVVEQVQVGKPAPTLLTMATKHKVDLVVMGAKGLDAVARFFLGSVSYELLQHARCSVLIVK